jgi:diacylglycerol kinase (ATP)
MTKTRFSLISRLGSFKYAFRGFWLLLRNEHNSRIHLLAAIVAIALGFILKINLLEWSVLVLVISIVIITELFNTSIETISDIIDNKWNESIRNAKDYAAAAVLVAAIISVAAGGFIFIPKLLELLK